LEKEINRAHPGQMGVLVDHMHDVVGDWLRQS
jgi:hypothetical protein